MHRCEEFRERIAERIIDREDLANKSEVQNEFLVCQSCSDFYAESREMMDALSSVEFHVPEEHWDAMTHRLRMSIINDRVQSERNVASSPSGLISSSRIGRWLAWDFGVPALAALAAVMLVTVGLYRLAAPLAEQQRPVAVALGDQQIVMDDLNVNLDPVTLDFLEQSELLLRNVMKLGPANTEDLRDAQQIAVQHLIRIDQRMEAASGAPPVQTMMSKYETILRDIRNLNQDTAAEDISDIQARIEKNKLIANMKAFQPPVTVVDVDEQ
jgi:hypothetical protein